MSPKLLRQDSLKGSDYIAKVDKNRVIMRLSSSGVHKKTLGLQHDPRGELFLQIISAINRIEQHLQLPPTDFSVRKQK